MLWIKSTSLVISLIKIINLFKIKFRATALEICRLPPYLYKTQFERTYNYHLFLFN